MNGSDETRQEAPTIDIGRFYAESLPRVIAFVSRILGDREAARDVAQEAFTIALEKADCFRGDSSALTWFLAIAKNLCLKRLSRTRERSFADIEALVDAHAEEPPAHTEAERRFYVDEVKNGCLVGLLQCLPFAQRCAFVLNILIGEPAESVAAIMGKTENSVRILISRAKASLRDFLCRNCSLLSEGAPCSCDRMLAFSLKRNLISTYRPEMSVPQMIGEIREFADEVELYRSLPELEAAIAELIRGGRYRILAKN